MSGARMIPRRWRRTAPLLLLLALAGCFPAGTAIMDGRHPQAFEQQTVSLIHPIGRAGIAFDQVERRALDRFLDRADMRVGETVVVASDPVRVEPAHSVVSHLEARGLTVARMRLDQRAVAPVLVIVQSQTAIATDCLLPTVDSITTPNTQLPFGCANAANLAAMLDRPADLQSPRDVGPVPGTTAARAVERYRAGDVEPLRRQDVTTDEF